MKPGTQIELWEVSSCEDGVAVVKLNAKYHIARIGQALCTYRRNPRDVFDQIARLSTLTSVYWAINWRFQKVFTSEFAWIHDSQYPFEERQYVQSLWKISWIWSALVKKLIEYLKEENIVYLDLPIAEMGWEELYKYYENMATDLLYEWVILRWEYSKQWMRFQLSENILLFGA